MYLQWVSDLLEETAGNAFPWPDAGADQPAGIAEPNADATPFFTRDSAEVECQYRYTLLGARVLMIESAGLLADCTAALYDALPDAREVAPVLDDVPLRSHLVRGGRRLLAHWSEMRGHSLLGFIEAAPASASEPVRAPRSCVGELLEGAERCARDAGRALGDSAIRPAGGVERRLSAWRRSTIESTEKLSSNGMASEIDRIFSAQMTGSTSRDIQDCSHRDGLVLPPAF